MGTVYIVGEKASFVHAGRMYKSGDEIKADIFEKAGLEAAIKSGKLLTKAQAEKATPPESSKKKEKTTLSADSKESEGNTTPPGDAKKTLEEMSTEELKAYAAEKNITVSGSDAEIVAAIKAAEGGK